MYAPLRWAIGDLRKFFVLDIVKRGLYLLNPERDFTRNRKLSFRRTAALVLGLLKKALP
ncbi:MAG: hypothetical protein JNK77_02655 [Saprospiraceae bacterium]|nr:hypothetical protein [Saprospiraceae bacterium]NUQ24737.1 hypothetical protein [Saprospiraceae bacterium]